jgi:hypothetical protein
MLSLYSKGSPFSIFIRFHLFFLVDSFELKKMFICFSQSIHPWILSFRAAALIKLANVGIYVCFS